MVGLDLALQQPDALGQHRGVLADGTRRAPLEEPGPQLALLGPGQPHHVLRVVGRPLDQRQGLEHRVVHVRRHLRPLLGQRPRLALGDEVAHQAEPPGAEDDDAGRDHERGAAERPQRGDGRCAPRPARTIPPRPTSDAAATTRASSQRRPSPCLSVPSIGTTSSSMNACSDSLALRQMRTMTPSGQEGGPAENPMNPTCSALVMNCDQRSGAG